jgi:hypothetical protein
LNAQRGTNKNKKAVDNCRMIMQTRGHVSARAISCWLYMCLWVGNRRLCLYMYTCVCMVGVLLLLLLSDTGNGVECVLCVSCHPSSHLLTPAQTMGHQMQPIRHILY